NLDYLQAVRNDHLNPLIRRVENEIAPVVAKLEHDISESVKNVTLNEATKTLKFDKGDGGYKDINLTPIMPVFSGIGVQSIQGVGPSTGVKLIQFPDATITPSQSGTSAAVGFDWTSIFNHNQKWPEAVVKGAVSHIKSIVFAGDPDATTTDGNNVTIRVPKITPLTVTSPDTTPVIPTPTEIKSIKITGNPAGTVIDAQGQLTLDLQAGGGGGITNQNFKGFFETLGDIQSQVTDPRDGKSFAFAKDSTLGGKYYTPYFYVNGAWQELKQDPALTYNSPTTATNQGVFSIKPSDKITIDSTGQLNLDGLSTPQLPQYFVGFFDTLDELKATVKNPVVKQSFAFVKSGGRGWITYRYDAQGSANLWSIVAPLGSFTFVDEAAASFTQVFGIKKSDAWSVDSRGILEMKGGGGGGPGGALSVGISGSDGQSVVHDVTAISFNKGKSFADFTGANNDHVLIDHPQRVINYNNTFEMAHNNRDYEGNIFYDETSRTWMGWGFSKDATPDQKWTRIVHPHMSDEVRDLVRRVPAKAKSVTPGLIGDSQDWDHIGTTFIEAGNSNLPAELKGTCGCYITTVVQDKDTAGVTIPQFRMQTALADREDGGTWIRRLLATGSPGSAISWSPWVKSSFGREEISTHEKDPNAHKDVIKFAAVHSIEGKMANIFNQTLEGFPGALRADGNYDILMDTYGHILYQLDRGTVPYDHWFDAEGMVEFSGYTGSSNYSVGKWTVHLRIKRKGTTTFSDIQKFTYVHTDSKTPYPPMKFKAEKIELVRGDELYMHVYFDNPKGLMNAHPDIYIVPIRSYIAYQDSETAAGTLIAASYRKLFGNVDVKGDVAVKVHHRDPDDIKSGIRVYGTRITREPTNMKAE
ncbi:MAG: hypothetical protein ACRC6V_12515, partial [Bacteroidales bacterium]